MQTTGWSSTTMTRIGGLLMASSSWDGCDHARACARSALDLERAAELLDALAHAHDAVVAVAALGRGGVESAAVVGDLEADFARGEAEADADAARDGVRGGVAHGFAR